MITKAIYLNRKTDSSKGDVMKRYEIYVIENGVEKSTKKIVRTVERAEELCAVYSDMDAGTGNTYTYKEVQKNTRG